MTSALPALSISATPRSVAEARLWVVKTCHSLDRGDVVECAELAISELVTNAILHGEPPLSVHLGGTPSHPRFEVSDGSRTPPQLPAAESGDDEMLTTIGRGLRLVALCSEAWGAQIRAEGKTVWFVPTTEPGASPDAEPQIDYEDGPGITPLPIDDPIDIHLVGIPVFRYRDYRRHLGELRRELRLLALANDSDYPIAGQLSELFQVFERSFTSLTQTALRGRRPDDVVDVDMVLDRANLPVVAQLLDMLEMADEFARNERLLAVAQTPAQTAFTRWYLGEYLSQGRGYAPVAWTEPRAEAPQPPRPRTAS